MTGTVKRGPHHSRLEVVLLFFMVIVVLAKVLVGDITFLERLEGLLGLSIVNITAS